MIKVIASCDCCGRIEQLAARSVAGGKKEIQEKWILASVCADNPHLRDQQLFCERCATLFGLLVPCPGEAHEIIKRGGDQDHCVVCAPRWCKVLADPPPVITIEMVQKASKIPLGQKGDLIWYPEFNAYMHPAEAKRYAAEQGVTFDDEPDHGLGLPDEAATPYSVEEDYFGST